VGAVGEVVLGVVDDMGCPQRSRQVHLRGAAYASDLRAQRPGQLPSVTADTARRAGDQYLLPCLDVAGDGQRVQGSDRGHWHYRSQAGSALSGHLARLGLAVRAVSRQQPSALDGGVEWRPADVTDPEAARDAAKGAWVICQCLNAPYTKWPALFPRCSPLSPDYQPHPFTETPGLALPASLVIPLGYLIWCRDRMSQTYLAGCAACASSAIQPADPNRHAHIS
jgi:hypothetical protein